MAHTATSPSQIPSSSSGAPRHNFIVSFVTGIVRFFDSLAASQRAVAHYDRLVHLSDAELEAKGLKREEIPHFVLEQNFGRN